MLPAGHHAELHRNTIERQYLHPYAIEVAVHRNVFTSEFFSLQDFTTADADIITDRYRKRVQPVSGSPCQILELSAYSLKHGQHKVTEPVQAPAVPALVQHLRQIALHLHEVPGMVQVTSKVQHRYKGSSDDFNVTDP